MLRIPILVTVCAILSALTAVGANAYPSYAKATGKTCGYCHIDPSGGGPLTTDGQYYLDHGTLPPTTPTPPATLTATTASDAQINLG